MPRPRSSSSAPATVESRPYQHPDASSASPPEIGAQPHFKKKLAPTPYRYDSSLSPELSWDTNPSREEGEALLAAIQTATTLEEAQAAARKLAKLSQPFLNWTGKAERLSFEVPTLPLFVHERLATSAILETLKSHKRDKQLSLMDDLFGVPERPLIDQVLRPYEHGERWVNRLVLGDSLLVMNSLLRYDGLGGQVQMIYMDPPYGVKFGSNFQPFVRKRDVKHNEDEDFTREPEMVQAYRDTWELGLHSYLTYLRDRLFLARDLLKPEGSIFVQISDENLHHVRELMDEIFGAENFVSQISYVTTSGIPANTLSRAGDYLVWYSKDQSRLKYHQLYQPKQFGDEIANEYKWVKLNDGSTRPLTKEEISGAKPIPEDCRIFRYGPLTSSGSSQEGSLPFIFKNKEYRPGANNHWKVTNRGLTRLKELDMLIARENSLSYYLFLDAFPVTPINNLWSDTKWGFDAREKSYVVQTNTKIIQRCMLMTTDPGDLVFDPTCGSGTTAYVAEQWGRRWVTCDTSRVPLALARQRILTATFPYYELQEAERGPAGGFVYLPEGKSKNPKSVGPGIVPHITLGSIANDEPPAEEVLVDRPEVLKGVVRVSGPFTVQATIPAASGIDDDPGSPTEWGESFANHTERMTEVLRRAPVLRLAGNQSVTLRNIRPPAKTLALSAEALLDDAEKGEQAVAIAFGPESGPISLRQTQEAWQEANLKGYSQLLLIGFGIDPKAREFVEQAGQLGIPAVYLQATMDLQMGDLLKNLRSSQVFSVCGLPEIEVHKAEGAAWQVKLLGLDTFDPVTMDTAHLKGDEVPAWFLDTDYNGLVFRVRQAFFPRTGAWESLKRALRAEFDDSVWEHLSGTTSAPFEAGDQRQVAVKVIDPRGNELTVVQSLPEAKVE
jgi:adenine-specific DNA-methyltransferase